MDCVLVIDSSNKRSANDNRSVYSQGLWVAWSRTSWIVIVVCFSSAIRIILYFIHYKYTAGEYESKCTYRNIVFRPIVPHGV